MERRNSPYRLALLAVVAATASACDGQGFKQASSKSNQQLAECSISIPANSTAMHLHQTVNKVLSAKLDACGGAIDVAGTSREFIGMEADESNVHLLFRIVPNDQALDGRLTLDARQNLDGRQTLDGSRQVLDGSRQFLDGAVADRAVLQ